MGLIWQLNNDEYGHIYTCTDNHCDSPSNVYQLVKTNHPDIYFCPETNHYYFYEKDLVVQLGSR